MEALLKSTRYVPALRKLRGIASVHVLEKPKITRLLQRLKEICREEGLSVDTKVLTALCELTEGDIRSCLNTLQVTSMGSSLPFESLFAAKRQL